MQLQDIFSFIIDQSFSKYEFYFDTPIFFIRVHLMILGNMLDKE